MIKFDEFENKTPECAACETMLADVLDDVLSPADQAWFDAHAAGCAACSTMLGEAQRGAAWLELLKNPRPEPSAGLLERILAQTSELEGEQPAAPEFAGAYVPVVPTVPGRTNVLPFRPRMPLLPAFRRGWLEPRLAMTAAMAFFSIALTLNLTGVKLNQLHASDLRPESVKRSLYQGSAQAVRYYDNLRVVHVMESRVEDLRQGIADDDRPLSAPKHKEPEQKDAPRKPEDGHGMSRRETPSAKPELLKTSEELGSKAGRGTGRGGVA